jgi:hypothetical protein
MTNPDEVRLEHSHTAAGQISVFNETECNEIHRIIYELRHLWIRRNRIAPFFTLGAASYLDGFILHNYLKQSQQMNPILFEQLKWMYKRLLEALEETLRSSVSLTERFALPGFHIFLSDSVFEETFASLHFDLQYDFLFKNQEKTDFSHPISFTLPISLPANGASLQMWDLHYEEAKHKDARLFPSIAATREKTVIDYKKGMMLVHSGHQLHQMAAMKDLQPADERITLQGHAILCDGTWQVYW